MVYPQRIEIKVDDVEGFYFLIGDVQVFKQRDWIGIYTINLGRVPMIESNMDSGRFQNYTTDRLYHTVEYHFISIITEWVQDRIDWIHQNLKGKWGISLDMKFLTSGTITWRFEEGNDALLFKLSTNPVS